MAAAGLFDPSRRPAAGSALFTLVLFLLSAGWVIPDTGESPEPIRITEWLMLGPAPSALPAFNDEAPGSFAPKDLLEGRQIRSPGLRPSDGQDIPWSPGVSLEWDHPQPIVNGRVDLETGDGPATAWLVTYIRADRFASIEVKIGGDHLLQIDLDDNTVATRAKSSKVLEGEEPEEGSNELKAKLDLEPGVHCLLVKTVADPDNDRPWSVTGALHAGTAETAAAISVAAGPRHPLQLGQILDAPRPTGVALSADGELAALTLQRTLPGTHDRETWIEVRRTATAELVFSFRGLGMRSVAWAPDGRRFTYITSSSGEQKDRSTLWLTDLVAGTNRPILELVERLGQYAWSPDGGSLVYEISDKPSEDKIGIQRLEGLRDRRAGFRERSYLHQVMIPAGSRRRLTAGRLSTAAGGVSPDGERLLFFRTPDEYDRRPFTGDELYLIDLTTLAVELVHSGSFINDAVWSPDGQSLLVRGGPGAFGGAGKTTPDDVIANDYDAQLFRLHLDSRQVVPLTRDFDPSILEMIWSPADGLVYLRAVDEDRVGLFRLDPETLEIDPIPSPAEVISGFDVARDAAVVLYHGSGVDRPAAIWTGPTDRKARLLLKPGATAYRHTRLGKIEPFNFLNSRGDRIVGRVHYPPDFDPNRRYPAIVYYYGGTFPVTRNFGGRYPLNWWAAHGYVVYVPQPSGTNGFGQEFSSRHVNAWGEYTADDILDGVDAFLEAYPFVDPDRVGCIGASYGGFMTQYLLTKTDRFAAGVSHAGISDLTSYWGEGYWGYAYNAVAGADSFPWNNRELYIEHSPLFHAEKINTPLLLLHGTADTNVPPGESEQMYTALKLLGRPVEYVRVTGQNHWILKHEQRIIWSKSIVAWFDRWLKDEPEWWDNLYPPPDGDNED
jgi:dipeptidyl aminopeptidase/acylaminoacyl peptidase